MVARPVYCVSTEAGCLGQTDFKILLCQLAAAFVVTSYSIHTQSVDMIIWQGRQTALNC